MCLIMDTAQNCGKPIWTEDGISKEFASLSTLANVRTASVCCLTSKMFDEKSCETEETIFKNAIQRNNKNAKIKQFSLCNVH